MKNQLDQLMALARLSALKRDRGLPTSSQSLHMVFMGPPGTGKTEIARKVGKLLKAVRVLQSGHLVEVDRAALVGGYQGQTGQLVASKIEQARDGVLFIDEAYALAGIRRGNDLSQPDSYGQEAIDTLLKKMEDMRDRLVVIVAGYPTEMKRFLQTNVGLASRFSLHFEFGHYEPDELMQIFENFATRQQMALTPDAAQDMRQEIDRLCQGRDDTFGNAREMRRLFERACQAQAYRLSYTDDGELRDDFEKLTNDELMTLRLEDIRVAFG
ncbi:AAA family ATPase [Jiella mangrovi]|uniref:AAA family ATPase n=1 Tax=Jiella mangrovi TaxID=2821407 RepID=A0ABS4BNF1_9HYPH|nr:AAA family ATPase [Jiella mangrovi]